MWNVTENADKVFFPPLGCFLKLDCHLKVHLKVQKSIMNENYGCHFIGNKATLDAMMEIKLPYYQ